MGTVLLAVVVGVTVLVLLLGWLNRQANRIGEYFLAATTTYLLFEDAAAGRAAALAAATAVGASRDKMLAILITISEAPDTLALLFMAADPAGKSGLQAVPLQAAAMLIRHRAATLGAEIVEQSGSLTALRQSLAQQAPEYEGALGGVVAPNPSVFSKLEPVAMGRLNKFFS